MKKIGLWILSLFAMLCTYVGIDELMTNTERENILPSIIFIVLFAIVFIAAVSALKLKSKYPYLVYLITSILFISFDVQKYKTIKIIIIVIEILIVLWILLGKQIKALINKIYNRKTTNKTTETNYIPYIDPDTKPEQTNTYNSIEKKIENSSEVNDIHNESVIQNDNNKRTYNKDYFSIYLSAEIKILESNSQGEATVKTIQKILNENLDCISLEQVSEICLTMDSIDTVNFRETYYFLEDIKVIDHSGKVIMKPEYLQNLSELRPIYIHNKEVNFAIDKNIPFGAYIKTIGINDDKIKQHLYELGILRKNYCGKYDVFAITNEQWEEYGKDINRIKPLISELRKTNEWHQKDLFDIDHMNGFEFEDYIVKLLIQNSYINVSLTKRSNDFGVDIICEKDDIKYAIQCKNYSHKLNNSPVQEVATGKNYYNCQVGAVITNNYFTENAKELAERNGILLWDRDKLSQMIKNAQT